MKIIIAPAKQMQVDTDSFAVLNQPHFLSQAQQIVNRLKKMNLNELQQLWKCSDRLAVINYENTRRLDLLRNQTPAVLAHTGVQYQSLGADLMTSPQLNYLQDHLRILSGLYGILRPFDGIVPYRLEMQARLQIAGQQNLYDFWGARIYHQLFKGTEVVINLASKEYARVIEPYLQADQQMITCVFGELVDGKVKQKATKAKIARGEMVRFMAENEVQKVAQLKQFAQRGYQFCEELSSGRQLVFLSSN
ncbi:peroxide stress protein YaaA [Pediococcus acidilactici]|uniref:peroxide stress protein YaaA n=1 Tax=Pediococcus acidilactici TaxID=1254 RepID=UPI00132162D6|nr:peroxide stress protein YaaA [Pediococcus acidilactici]KAF0415682.1 peroxide stress protein YaaA [Pediococcus acidilactici]